MNLGGREDRAHFRFSLFEEYTIIPLYHALYIWLSKKCPGRCEVEPVSLEEKK